MATLAIVEDHELVAQSLAVALRAEGHEVTIVALTSPDDVVADVLAVTPDLVLLDLDLGDRIGAGIELIRPLTEGGAPVLMVTGNPDQASLGACLEAGALGIATKADGFDRLVEQVRAVLDGSDPMVAARRVDLADALRDRRVEVAARMAPFATLTKREQDVLRALIAGQQADAIAATSYTSVATVRTQIAAVLRKLGVSSQLQAVALARDAGWS
jgi:DNA-binding NarL/FixJ family response regulator